MLQQFPQPNAFKRTKQDQQIWGVPYKVAGTVDKAANLSHEWPNDLAAFLLLAGAYVPSCQRTVRSVLCL